MTIVTKIGFGKKVAGEIVFLGNSNDLAGKIVVCLSNVGREFLEKAGLVGVVAVVVPSIHFRDFEYFKNLNDFPLLVLLKFGKLELEENLVEKLQKLDGKKAVLDGEAHLLQIN